MSCGPALFSIFLPRGPYGPGYVLLRDPGGFFDAGQSGNNVYKDRRLEGLLESIISAEFYHRPEGVIAGEDKRSASITCGTGLSKQLSSVQVGHVEVQDHDVRLG